MDKKTYRKMLNKQFIGLKVRTLKELRNGLCTIAAGTVCTITQKRGGFSLETERCPCCGVKVDISRVPPEDVDLIAETNKSEAKKNG